MEISNSKIWVTQPNVCRCCLAATGTWDLTTSYTAKTGLQEVFADMLQECYGIRLSHLTDWGSSRLACQMCVVHLKDACAFRKQVLEAEHRFLEHWRDIGDLSVKLEEDDLQFNAFEELPSFHDDTQTEGGNKLANTESSITETKASPLRQGRKTKVKASRKRKRIVNDKECNSETPLDKLSSKNDVLGTESIDNNDRMINVDTTENLEVDLNECDLGQVQVRINEQHPTRDLKRVSERRRLILTCAIVLKDTTACPFRHHKSWFQCFFCSQDFMEINLLRHHIVQSHSNIDQELNNIKRYPRSLQIDITDLKCRHCDLSLSNVEAMTVHFESVHQKVVYKECIADYKVNASPYTCHICKLEFHVFRTLTTHLNEHYANCICDVCGKSFMNSKRLKVHKRTHEHGTYPCAECGKVLKTKTSKANHMESAHSKRVVKCQICFKPMKHYNDRIKHMSEVHNITHKFKCTICSREYNIKHYLATHMRQTHGHKNKKCLECGMAFITNHGLKKHMLRHSGEKPYTCAVCSKSYVRSYTLREHMRVHNAEKKIQT